MALNIPVPKIVPDVGPGGQIFDVYNRLTQEALKNKMQQLQNQYYAPNMESQIGYRNALAGKVPYDIDYEKSQTNQINKLLPGRIEELNLKNQYYPQLTNAQINANNALAENRKLSGGGLGAGAKEQNFYQQLVARENPNLNNDPARVYEASNVLARGGTQLSDGTPLQTLSPAARGSLDRIVKYGTNTQGLNQQRYANTLDNLVLKADENAQGAVKYSGLLGASKGSLDKATQLLGGANNPDYQKYLNFTRVDVPTMAGEFMRELGTNASDEQKRMYKEVVNPISWDTNPQMALARWNYFKEIMKNVGSSVSQSPSEIRSNLQNNSTKSQASSDSNLVKITNTKTGKSKMVTIDEAKKLGVKNV